MSIDYALTSKKLKIWHSNGQVSVFQDGSAADGDVSPGRQYDDFWRTGANISSSVESAKIGIRLGSMEFGANSPASFSFEILDRIVNNVFDIDLNDLVEFWADTGPALTPSITDFPSWHLNEQTPGQVRLFRGRVVQKTPRLQTPGRESFTVQCLDPRGWADEAVLIQRDLPGGIELPHLIVNAETDEKGWKPAIKKTNDPAWPTHATIATGVPTTDGGKLTIRDLLAYLSDTYATDLSAAGVKEVGVDLFHDDDLEPLTTVLPKMDFVETGFYEAVRRIMQFAPDFSLTVDPKTTQWRIYRSRQLLVPGERALTTAWSDLGSTVEVTVDDGSIFSATPGDPGNWLLLVDANDARFSWYAQVQAKAGAVLTIFNPGRAYATGSRVYPLESFDVQLPVIPVDLKAGMASASLEESLSGVFTAVRIVSHQETRSERTATRNTLVENLIPGWDDGFETNWNLDKADREEDRGADGLGIILYGHTVSGSGKSVFQFLAANSQYGDDHSIVSTIAEWQGCAVQLVWHGNADVSRQNPRFASRIESMVYVADMDGAGHPGYSVTVAHDFTTHPDGPGAIYTTSSPGPGSAVDRIKLTHDFSLKDLDGNRAPAKLNANFEVGKKWALSDTLMEEIASSAPGCAVGAQISGLAGINQAPVPAYNPAQGGAPMTLEELNAFWTQRVGAGNFAARGFFLKRPITDLEYGSCGATNPPQPPTVEVKYTYITNTVRQVRVPNVGYGGLANALYGLERERVIMSDRFTDDSQEAIYEDICRALFRDVSEPHHGGDLELIGLKPWVNLADLCCRVQLRNDDWTYYTASLSYINKFRAALSRVVFDFASQHTTLRFARQDALEALEGRVLEDLYVKEPEKEVQRKETEMNLVHAVECLQKPQPPVFSTIPGCRVQHTAPAGGPGRPGSKPPTLPPKQEGQGTNESSIGVPIVNGGAGRNWVNKGPQGGALIERDYLGQLFLWDHMASQALSESGSTGTKLTGSTKRYMALPQVNRDSIKAVVGAFLGGEVAYRGAQVHARIGAGSTTTVIEIDVVGLKTNEFQGGTVEIIGEEDLVRPIYDIASNDADSVTLTGAMSEAAPREGAVAVLRGPGLPPLDETDFPDGGVILTDAAGNLFVVDPTDGTMTSAQLVGGVVEEKTSSPNSPVFDLGQSGMKLQVKGDLDLSTADSVSGLPSSDVTSFTDPNSHYQGDETSIPELFEELGFVLADATRSWIPNAGLNSPRFWNQAETFVTSLGYVRQASDSTTTTLGYKLVRIPKWAKADGSNVLYVDVYWSPATIPGADQAWVFQASVKAADVGDSSPGSSMTSAETSIAVTTTMVAPSIYRSTLTMTSPDLYTGAPEFANVIFRRLGSDGADTYTGRIDVIGFDLRSGVKST